MLQEKLSPPREEELKLHLQTKLIIKLSSQVIKKIVNIVNQIRREEIKLTDWVPGLEDKVRYVDMLQDFMIEDFLIL